MDGWLGWLEGSDNPSLPIQLKTLAPTQLDKDQKGLWCTCGVIQTIEGSSELANCGKIGCQNLICVFLFFHHDSQIV